MVISNEDLKKLLVVPGFLDPKIFDEYSEEARAAGKDIDSFLIEKKIFESGQLGHLISEAIGAPYVNLSREKISEDVIRSIPEVTARVKKVLPFFESKDIVKIAMVDPNDLGALHSVEKHLNKPAKAYLAMEDDFRQALACYRLSLKAEYDTIIASLKGDLVSEEQKSKLRSRVVDLLLEHGFENKASDIHIEPVESGASIRFRIDGVMHEVLRCPRSIYELILLRVKVLAKMKIDEHMAAQDGKFHYKTGQADMDVRVSIVPIIGGENIVLRLLSEKNRQVSLNDLGFNEAGIKLIKEAINHPHGMILVVGPTGSGKTTTIYSMLEELNRSEVHISTIEDPVEYNIEGLSQIQVNEKAGLTFAKGLRAIVRQDPDIIMVGEIRDEETANIAINSAMTGHLVLSTLHANDAAATLPRLIEMGIKPFLIASTVKIVISQRLVRRVCEKCRSSYTISDEEKDLLAKNPEFLEALGIKDDKKIDSLMLYKGSGCKLCARTGYRGRVGIFEILEMDDRARDAVINKNSSREVERFVHEHSRQEMIVDGAKKILEGATTLSEIFRAL